MNKYLILGVGAVALLVAGYFLVTRETTKQTATPSVILGTPTPQPTSAQLETEERKVNVTKAGFEPLTLKIKAGTKVVWENKSGGIANVSSVPHPIHTLYPFLNLGDFDDGKSLEVVFEDAGTYKYHNHLDSSQTGTVVVE